MALSVEKFVERLSDSGLMTAEEVSALTDSLPLEKRPADGQELARLLLREKKLTKYQATAVYKGQTGGLVLGNYIVLDQIGEGGMGQVLKAQHKRMKRKVAVKVLPREVVSNADALDRFHREVEAAAKLNHPNIVTAFDADEAGGIHFLVMEHVEGKDLSVVLKQHGPLPLEQAVECTLQAAQGLAYAHEHGVIHRDIKPGNLILSKDGTVKILDMGLARIDSNDLGDPEATAARQLTQSGQMMGTVDYMSPEQAEDTRLADQRADIYALGCTMYRLLTGSPAFEGDTVMKKLLAHRETPIPSLCKVRADVPEALDAVFAKMLAKDPADRQQSMPEVIAEIEAALDPNQSPQRRVSEDSSSGGLTEFFDHLSDQSGPTGTKQQAPAIVTENTIEHRASQETDTEVRRRGKRGKKKKKTKPTRQLQGGGPKKNPTLMIVGGAGLSAVVLGLIVFLTRGEDPVDDVGKVQSAANDSGASSNDGGRFPNYALKFDGKRSYVEIPLSGVDSNGPLTVEMLGNLHDLAKWYQTTTPDRHVRWIAHLYGAGEWWFRIECNPNEPEWDFQRQKTDLPWTFWQGPIADASSPSHIAMVWDGKDHALYLDGVPLRGTAFPDRPRENSAQEDQLLILGASRKIQSGNDLHRHFLGTLDEIRISSTVRYNAAFQPPKATTQFAVDDHTIALYHCDEGQGSALTDSSGHNHHGQITGATWVRVGSHSSAAATADWTVLFDGSDTSHFQSLGPFAVEDGTLVASTKGMAVSRNAFDNFELEFQWKVAPGANGGVYYRSPANVTRGGNEYQLIDNAGHPNGLKPMTKAGSLHNQVAAERDMTRPVGTWNDSRIVCQDARVEHWMNGQRVLSYDAQKIGTDLQGHILLQGWSGTIFFKNVRIRALDGDTKLNSAQSPPDDPDRAAAEWALGMGAKTTLIFESGKLEAFSSVSELPSGSFRLYGVNFLPRSESRRAQVVDSDLLRLNSLTALRQLNLVGTKITDAGIIHLNSRNPLKVLYLYGTDVSDVGLEHVKKLSSLTKVDLSRTNVTSQGVADLKKALPNCEITWDGGK